MRISQWSMLLTILIAGCGEGARDTHALRIVLDVEMGPDVGQPLGTFFELHDGERLVAAAGMQQLSGTHLSNNGRVLSFFVCNEHPTEYMDMGDPFPGLPSHTRLFNWQNTLYAITRAPMPAMARRLAEDGTWQNAPELDSLFGDRIRNLEVVDGALLIFHDNAITFGGDTLLHRNDVEHLIGVLRNGTMLIHLFGMEQGPNLFMLADWRPDEKERIVPRSLHADPAPVPDAGFVYCMIQVDSSFLVGNNFGGLYKIHDEGLEVVYLRQVDDPSWQPYCFLTMHDAVLIGHYPTGRIMHIDEHGLGEHEPPLLRPDGVPERSREAQALALYGGSLFCGVWPWGEVHELELATERWKPAQRLFTLPEVDPMNPIAEQWDAPYVQLFHEARNGSYNNAWGQRVTGFTLHGNALYASTSNKGMAEHDTNDLALLGDEVVAQYGRVHRLVRHGALSAHIAWRAVSRFELECDGDRILIIQDGDTLASARTGSVLTIGANGLQLRSGKGVYGKSQAQVRIREMVLTRHRDGHRITYDGGEASPLL